MSDFAWTSSAFLPTTDRGVDNSSPANIDVVAYLTMYLKYPQNRDLYRQ